MFLGASFAEAADAKTTVSNKAKKDVNMVFFIFMPPKSYLAVLVIILP
jgi:hypothetical protein